MRYLHHFLSKATPVFTPGAASNLDAHQLFQSEKRRDKKQSEMTQESHSGVLQTAENLAGIAAKSQYLV